MREEVGYTANMVFLRFHMVSQYGSLVFGGLGAVYVVAFGEDGGDGWEYAGLYSSAAIGSWTGVFGVTRTVVGADEE